MQANNNSWGAFNCVESPPHYAEFYLPPPFFSSLSPKVSA